MVRPKTEEEIELLRINGDLVSRTLAEVGKLVAPGVTTAKLNEVAETFIRDHGAVPSFKEPCTKDITEIRPTPSL